MLENLFETIGSLGGPWAYLAVALLAAGESSLGVGLVVPGETGMLVGGFIVSRGNATFGLMWTVAVLGAIVGDSLGYEIGRRFGPRIRRTRLGQKVGEERWVRAEAYLGRRGGKAIFLGRFVAVVRSLVPAVAGISRMPYPKFLAWNATGAVLWATLYVSLGYAAGQSYDRVADAAEGAGYVLLVLVVLVAIVVLTARWVAHNQERVRTFGDRLAGLGPVAFVRRHFAGPIRFVRRRFQFDEAFGLSLTVGLVMLILATWALVTVVTQVSRHSDLVNVDLSVARWFAERRVEWLTDTMERVTDLGSVAILAPLLGALAVGWIVRTGRWGVGVFLVAAFAGAVVATDVLKDLIERPRPPVSLAAASGSGSGFPSGHTAQATVAFSAIAYLYGSVLRMWAARVTVWAAAVMLSVVVGFSRLYLGVHWLSDVLGGYALAAAWMTGVIIAFGASTRLHRQRRRGAGALQERSVISRTA